MDDKDLHWIRVWDIISAAAIFCSRILLLFA